MGYNDYKIFQAKIVSKDPITPRQYSVVHIPEGYLLSKVQMPNALKDQSAPLVGSIVLVAQLGVYQAYIVSVLREPFDVLTSRNQFRGLIPSTGDVNADITAGANPIQDGEIFMEATGPLSPTGQVTPGFGASLYLGNNGSAQIQSGSMGERLVIGGTGSDNDHEVVLSADNGYFESNPDALTYTQSTFNFDSFNTVQVANQIANPINDDVITISELNMDALGNTILRNTIYGTGTTLNSISLSDAGKITISSYLAGTPKATIEVASAGTVNINSGLFGAARANDLTISNLSTDPVYWVFVNAIQAFFIAISAFQGNTPVLQSQLGALGTAFLAQSPIPPPSMTSRISTASKTVVIGG